MTDNNRLETLPNRKPDWQNKKTVAFDFAYWLANTKRPPARGRLFFAKKLLVKNPDGSVSCPRWAWLRQEKSAAQNIEKYLNVRGDWTLTGDWETHRDHIPTKKPTKRKTKPPVATCPDLNDEIPF